MDFKDVIKNNRLEIELENDDTSDRLVRGMVLDVFKQTDEFIIVDEFGNLRMIDNNNILSMDKVTLDRKITDALYDYKEYYRKKKKYEKRLQRLKEQFPVLQEQVLDAHFLTKFNIHGAFVRINKFIPDELKTFYSHDLKYKIKLDYNLNDEIEIKVTVLKEFEYYEVNPKIMDEIKNTNKPDKSKELSDAFKDEVIEQSTFLNHIEKDLYEVGVDYLVLIPISEKIYVEKKNFIYKAIHRLKRVI